MVIELKPEQQEILDRASKAGLSPDEVLDRAFEVIREQLDREDWMIENRDAIAAHIEEGLQQAARGELIEGEDVIRMLRQRRAKREVA